MSWWEENVSNSQLVVRIREGSTALKVVLVVTAVLLVLLMILIIVVWRLKKRASRNQ